MAALSSKPNNKMELMEFNHKRVINNVPSEPYNELYEANWSMNHENVNVNRTKKRRRTRGPNRPPLPRMR